jgi:uncharacterized phage-associated protein
MQATYDERKLTELLLYVAERLTSDVGGAAKIDKVVYFADFAHVRRTGSPITGAEYQKLHDGPAPRRLKAIRDALVECGDAEISMEDFLGYSLHRLTPRRAADTSMFSEVELATIHKVIDDLHGLNAQQVSDLSRGEAGWRLVDFGETIPYESALLGAAQISTPTRRRLERTAAAQHGLLPA